MRGHQPVVLLHGRAEGDVGLLDAALERRPVAARRHRHVEPEPVDEGGEEGEQPLELELVGQRHHPPPAAGRQPRHHRLHQRAPLAERVRRQVGELCGAGPLVPERAAAAPGEAPGLAPHVGGEPVDAAVVAGAAAALRRGADELVLARRPGPSRKRRRSAGARLATGSSAGGQQRDADRPLQPGARRHDHLGAGLARHRGGQRVGGEGHPLAEDHLPDRAAPLDAVEVVGDHRVVEPGQDRAARPRRAPPPRR